MQKTTVYLPTELKRALERASAVRGASEAELIREGISLVTRDLARPRPRIPLFASGEPDLAEHVDDAMRGFGEG